MNVQHGHTGFAIAVSGGFLSALCGAIGTSFASSELITRQSRAWTTLAALGGLLADVTLLLRHQLEYNDNLLFIGAGVLLGCALMIIASKLHKLRKCATSLPILSALSGHKPTTLAGTIIVTVCLAHGMFFARFGSAVGAEEIQGHHEFTDSQLLHMWVQHLVQGAVLYAFALTQHVRSEAMMPLVILGTFVQCFAAGFIHWIDSDMLSPLLTMWCTSAVVCIAIQLARSLHSARLRHRDEYSWPVVCAASTVGGVIVWLLVTPEVRTLWWSLASGLSTGIGGLLLVLVGEVSAALHATMLGGAAGVMIVLSTDLLWKNFERHDAGTLIVFVVLGFVVFTALELLVTKLTLSTLANEAEDGHELQLQSPNGDPDPSDPESQTPYADGGIHSEHSDDEVEQLQLVDRESMQDRPASSDVLSKHRSWILTALIVSAHNLPEGALTAMATMSEDQGQGSVLATVVAVALHNVPEGLACASPVYLATNNLTLAVVLSTLSGLSEPIGALLTVNFFRPFLTEYRLDCASITVASIMITVSMRELWPEARRHHPQMAQVGVVLGALVFLFILSVLPAM
jgi:zinc transporter ZupT